jgi:hypothetical protein
LFPFVEGNSFQFKKRAEDFVGAGDKAPSVVAMRVSNPDCSSVV